MKNNNIGEKLGVFFKGFVSKNMIIGFVVFLALLVIIGLVGKMV